jgi:hypothetical protein
MPRISLVVCLYSERDLLRRLLEATEGIFDDLVVVHDGAEGALPDSALESIPAIDFATAPAVPMAPSYRIPTLPPLPGSIHDLVCKFGGRFFVGPRRFQQEPHWPFAWQQAEHDWILRLDADEFPSDELKEWLLAFKLREEPATDLCGYTCVWPLWDGQRAVSRRWPAGRQFLINRARVHFFGMVEQLPVPDGRFEPLPIVLRHEPVRKSYGIGNLIIRKQAYRWRRVIAESLLGQPTALPRWRWNDASWPVIWEDIRRRPLWTALNRLVRWSLRGIRDVWRVEGRFLPNAAVCGGIHHFLIALLYFQLRKKPLP